MIPLRLQLQNFLSYGEGVPPLDLTGIRLACLSGDNGNGKSALLDAITWTLFGETRARSEDDLIRLGAKDCAVLFDFQVGTTRYRVRRQRDRRGGTLWELGIWQDDGLSRPLTGTSARETKARIEAILRMDYKTFLSTAYLAQGQSDIFARATPGERKKVLADILDLSRYEQLEQRARERQKEAEGRQLDAERELSAIDSELARRDEFLEQSEIARARQAEAHALQTVLQAEHETALARCERLEGDIQKMRDLEEKIADARGQIAERTSEIDRSAHRLSEAQTILTRKAQIEAAHARSEKLSTRLRPLEEKYHQGIDLQREASALETTIRRESEQIERESYRLATEIETLEREGEEIGRYDEEIRRMETEQDALGAPETRRMLAESALREIDATLGEYKARLQTVKTEREKRAGRLPVLAASDAPACDFCGQPLTPRGRQEAIAALQEEIARLDHEIQEIVDLGKSARRDAEEHRTAAAQALHDLHRLQDCLARKSHAEQERLRLTERGATLPERRMRLATLAERLQKKDFAVAEQERLMQVSAQIEKLERIGQEIAKIRTEREGLRGVERDMTLLESAAEVARTEPERIAAHQAFVADRQARIEKARQQVALLRAQTDALPALQRERDDTRRRWEEAQRTARDAERLLGQIAAQLERLEALTQRRPGWEEERQRAAHDREIHRELSAAFGKKGVQALIIENALPELEQEANRLLARMTQGAMSVRLQTQKEAKSRAGSTIETLEIILSDDMGTRPYEMFSGGEAFRVNLALRVALSRLLARRAGAPLQTLILDEGFGTQDPRGREAIADALHAVSEDFALVLVITHIDELKEAFPTRIEVLKGPEGSTFTVI